MVAFATPPGLEAPVFLQAFGKGDLLNEPSSFTPYATEYGTLVASQTAELLSFPASSMTLNSKFDQVVLEINRNMMVKKAHLEMVSDKLMSWSPGLLAQHQARLVAKHRIDTGSLESKLGEAGRQRKLAKFEQLRNIPSNKESTFKVDVLATQNFGYTRNLEMNAAKLKSSIYLREMVGHSHQGAGLRTGATLVAKDEAQREADRKANERLQMKSTLKAGLEERDLLYSEAPQPAPLQAAQQPCCQASQQLSFREKMKTAGEDFNQHFLAKLQIEPTPGKTIPLEPAANPFPTSLTIQSKLTVPNPAPQKKMDDFGILKKAIGNSTAGKKSGIGRLGGLPL